jgi:hypothetical protein
LTPDRTSSVVEVASNIFAICISLLASIRSDKPESVSER